MSSHKKGGQQGCEESFGQWLFQFLVWFFVIVIYLVTVWPKRKE